MATHITIVGVGALGSHVALALRNLKIVLKVVDFDRVETRNLQAQFHTKMGLGRNKAQALAQSLQGLFGVKIEVVPHRLTSSNADVILADSGLVIDCTDNFQARQDIRKACQELGLPCLHGALSADGDFGRVIWDEHFVPDSEGWKDQPTCEDGEHLPFFSLAASLMAVEARSFLKTKKKRSFQLTPAGYIRLT